MVTLKCQHDHYWTSPCEECHRVEFRGIAQTYPTAGAAGTGVPVIHNVTVPAWTGTGSALTAIQSGTITVTSGGYKP